MMQQKWVAVCDAPGCYRTVEMAHTPEPAPTGWLHLAISEQSKNLCRLLICPTCREKPMAMKTLLLARPKSV